MLRRDRERFFGFLDAARSQIPGLLDLDIATPKSSARRVDLRLEGGLTLPADAASAGVRLVLFFLALAWHPTPPSLVLLEEPETGVHPKRLQEIVALLRGLTTGQHAPTPVQVVFSTHSPYLLDHIDLERDGVLVFRREEDGSRSARPVRAKELKEELDGLMLGELWWNLGEAGLVTRP